MHGTFPALYYAALLLYCIALVAALASLTGCDGSDPELTPTRTLVSVEVTADALPPGTYVLNIQNGGGRNFSATSGNVPGMIPFPVTLPEGTYTMVAKAGVIGDGPPATIRFETPAPGQTVSEILAGDDTVLLILTWEP